MSIEESIKNAGTQAEGVEVAHKGLRKALDDIVIPLISEKRVSLIKYGDMCFALGFLGSAAGYLGNALKRSKAKAV